MGFGKKLVVGSVGIAGIAVGAGAYGANYWLDNSVAEELPAPNESYDDGLVMPQESYVCLDGQKPEECNSGNALVVLSIGNYNPVALEQIDTDVINALISTEDRNFYEHNGVDKKGLARVIVQEGVEVITDQDIRADQGGSTITMQLLRNIYVDVVPENDLERKKWELEHAPQFEEVYSKDEILSKYLNIVNYGRGAYGIENAAQMYFGKSAVDLTITEAAELIATVNGPGLYEGSNDPDRNNTQMTNLLVRRNKIINDMADAGFISQEDADNIYIPSPLNAIPYQVLPGGMKADYSLANQLGARHFVDDVLEEVRVSSGYTDEQITRNLRIMTTLNFIGQAAIINSITDSPPPPNGSQYAVVMQRADGAIVGMYGGDRNNSEVDLTDKPTVTGSADKIYAYAEEFENGDINLETVLPDPPSFTWEGGDNGKDWSIQGGNYCASDESCTVAEAIAKSSNPVILQLMENRGTASLDEMRRIMTELGVNSNTPAVPAIVTGATEASLLDRTTGINGLVSNNGKSVTPYRISTIWALENTIFIQKYANPAPEPKPVVSEATSEMLTTALRAVPREGTAKEYLTNFPSDIVGKTGTHDDNIVASFLGVACLDGIGGNVSMGVMIGHIEGYTSLGDGQTGGKLPALMFSKIGSKLVTNYCEIS
jgi:penicillin-binding protein 1A